MPPSRQICDANRLPGNKRLGLLIDREVANRKTRDAPAAKTVDENTDT